MSTQKLLDLINSSILRLQAKNLATKKKGTNKAGTASFKRIIKTYCEIMVRSSQELSLEQCCSLLQLFQRVGIDQGVQSLFNAINKRLVTIFEEACQQDQAEITRVMLEIFKTQNKALHRTFLQKLVSNDELFDHCGPQFHYQLLITWQR